VTRNQTPTFSGNTGYSFFEELGLGVVNRVAVVIYRGTSVFGEEVQPPLSTKSRFLDPTWSAGPAETLLPGTYTAQAEMSGEMSEEVLTDGEAPTIGTSLPVTFTVDTTPPPVSLTSPATGSSTTGSSQVIAGSAGTNPGDLPAITVQLFAGSTMGSQAPLEGLTVQASGGSWSATFGALSPGTYTARAEQTDEAGNVGTSEAVTFTVTTPPPPPPPTPPLASFKWFPSAPKTGEHVSLVSSSTDKTSPITAFAWALTSKGAFNAGTPMLTTSFATAGEHIVRLRVTAADGLSSVATETIRVIQPPLTLMAPFPIVRIAGSVTSSGVSLSLLTVLAPVGARLRVTCRGRGCPTASESRVAASSSKKSRATMVVIAFRRFQGSLAAGAILEIRIFKHGRIGKYTSFEIRHGRLPKRVDTCLGQAGIKPIACPSS
jgi:hypothetical protein